jgi:hypothetical protein
VIAVCITNFNIKNNYSLLAEGIDVVYTVLRKRKYVLFPVFTEWSLQEDQLTYESTRTKALHFFKYSINYGIFRADAGNCDLHISHTTDKLLNTILTSCIEIADIVRKA